MMFYSRTPSSDLTYSLHYCHPLYYRVGTFSLTTPFFSVLLFILKFSKTYNPKLFKPSTWGNVYNTVTYWV